MYHNNKSSNSFQQKEFCLSSCMFRLYIWNYSSVEKSELMTSLVCQMGFPAVYDKFQSSKKCKVTHYTVCIRSQSCGHIALSASLLVLNGVAPISLSLSWSTNNAQAMKRFFSFHMLVQKCLPVSLSRTLGAGRPSDVKCFLQNSG